MNQHGEEAIPKRRSRACGCIVAAMIVLFILVAVPGTLYFWWVTVSAQKVEAALAELRAVGEPTTLEELDAFYKLPEGAPNVAALWREAILLIDTPQFTEAAKEVPIISAELPDEEHVIPPPSEPWPRLDAAEKLLDQYAESLRLMHQASAAGGRARYRIDWSKGFDIDFQHAFSLRQGARLLAVEARVRAHRGDWPGAAESLEAIQRMAGSLEREPLFVSYLVRNSLRNIGIEEIESLLPYSQWTDEDLARLQSSLEPTDNSEATVRALKGERALGIDAMLNPRQSWELAGGSGEDRLALAARLAPRNDDLLLYLDAMGRMAEAARLPAPARLDAAKQTEADVVGALEGGGAVGRFRYALTAMLLPSVESLVRSGVRDEGTTRVAVAAIACERFHRAEGRWPESLDALVPRFLAEVPIDPFDGQALRYLVEDDGREVYSIGPNRVDDGGRENEEDSSQGDLVFPLRREGE